MGTGVGPFFQETDGEGARGQLTQMDGGGQSRGAGSDDDAIKGEFCRIQRSVFSW